LLLTEGCKAYMTALLTHDGQWGQPARRQAQGPTPQPRGLPWPQRLDAHVGKTVRRRRLGAVQPRVVCGTIAAVQPVLSPLGWQINTALVERLNRDIRQRVAAVGRRVNTRCQGEDSLPPFLAGFHVYHHCVLPHASWRPPLAAPIPTNGTG